MKWNKFQVERKRVDLDGEVEFMVESAQIVCHFPPCLKVRGALGGKEGGNKGEKGGEGGV